MVQLFGKSAAFSHAGVVRQGKGWTVNPTVADLRTDNTGTNGFSDRIGGMKDCTFVMEQDWDASLNILDSPPALGIASVILQCLLYLDQVATSPFWNFPKALVLSTPMTALVDQVEKITINCGNKGGFSMPTGAFTPSAAASS